MDKGIFPRVREYIEKYHMIAPGDTVVTGVSGGADSVCLFLLLCMLKEQMDFQIVVVHVDHGIRKEAKQDAAYVKRLCEEKGIPFVLVEEDVKAYARAERLSEEEAGRKIRYRAFDNTIKNCVNEEGKGRIAVAHNANDRAETMLFHLFRGTGLAGASGMKPVRDNIIRPILCLKRVEIEEYLREKQISFCIDHTNMEDTYTRNRIRNHIIPFAEKEICPGTVTHMCEAADILLETEMYIRRQAEDSYRNCVLREEERRVILDVDRLLAEDPLIRKQVLLQSLEMLTEGRKDITSVHIREIVNLLYKSGSKRISLPYGLMALKEYERLVIYRDGGEEEKEEKIIAPESIPIAIPGKVKVPGLGTVEMTLLAREEGKNVIFPEKSCTKWFDYDRITKSLMFRTRETGDYLTINKKFSRKSLKDYMIGEKIPKDQRGNLYVLADGSHILWVPGYRISEYYKIKEDTKHILQVQIGGGL